MDRENIKKLPYKSLKKYTRSFSKENYIGEFQFGKLYRGKARDIIFKSPYVTVKFWEVPEMYNCHHGDNELRMTDELVLLRHEKLIHHPCMPKVYGFCWEGEHLGVVYEFKSLDTVKNLLVKDDFTWVQRIKVAIGIAHLLKFLHARNPLYEPFLIRNLDAAHIMLDEEHNPKLIDFGMISGGIFTGRRVNQSQPAYGCYAVDPSWGTIGGWTEKSDVFAFGGFLLCLITKRVFGEGGENSVEPFINKCAWTEHGSGTNAMGNSHLMHSLVQKNLEADPIYDTNDGISITRLAMQCVDHNSLRRPTMKQVVKCLLKLQVVQNHAGSLGLDHVLRGRNTNAHNPRI